MNFFSGKIIVTGLAIFSMFFGAGNLIFALSLGVRSGSQTPLALLGFVITAVLLPIVGIVSILLFNGNYRKFYSRLGKIPGFSLCLACFLVIGPLVAMPRIVTLTHTMFLGHFPNLSLSIFAVSFLLLTLILSISESKVIDVLGKFISPVLIVSIIAIIIIGLSHQGSVNHNPKIWYLVVLENMQYGYNTLDFLTAAFFSSIVIKILKISDNKKITQTHLIRTGLGASLIGMFLLALVYIGLAILGSHHAVGVAASNEGEIFRQIIYNILGHNSSLIMTITIFLACLSTNIALAVVSAEFMQNDLCKNFISYKTSLIITLAIVGIISSLGLSRVIEFSKPVISAISPAILTLCVLNIFYKIYNLKMVKIPVLVVFMISIYANFLCNS